jgi:hypothetical protein
VSSAIVQNAFGVIVACLLAIVIDWSAFGQLESYYTDKTATYRLQFPRVALITSTSVYGYWALWLHQAPNQLPLYCFGPFVIGLALWGIILVKDVKCSLVDRSDDRYGP